MNYAEPGWPEQPSKYAKFKELTPELIDTVSAGIKSLLHCHRDALRNIYLAKLRDGDPSSVDPRCYRFDCREGYYGEAFGMMRTLELLGYGYLGSVNIPGDKQPEHNLRWWFEQLQDDVLKEEGWGSDGVCEHCRDKWSKDDSQLAGMIEETELWR